MRVLACDGIHEDGLTLFRDAGWSVKTVDAIKDPGTLSRTLADVDVLIVRSATKVPAEALVHATHLRVIGRAGAGVDTIDVEAATDRGVAVMNAPDGNTLAACFDAHGGVDEAFVKELATHKPLRVVFRDAGFKDSAVKINVEQIFKLLSPATEVKCI